MTFGEKLKALRKETGLTQEEVAKKLGIGLRTLAYYEQDVRKPRTDAGWKKLADFYSVSVNYLKIDETIENIPEFNSNSLVEVMNHLQREIERAAKFVKEYFRNEGYFVKEINRPTIKSQGRIL